MLVIDDDEDVRQFIVAGLQEYGHDVTEAGSGQEGIARFVEVDPDLVILDFLMPGMSGAEVASHILAAKPDQRILFVSGYSETDAIRKVAPDAKYWPSRFVPRSWTRRFASPATADAPALGRIDQGMVNVEICAAAGAIDDPTSRGPAGAAWPQSARQ